MAKETAMAVARRAEQKANVAHELATVLSGALSGIMSGVEAIRHDLGEELRGLRTENSRQHEDNKKSVVDGLEKVHQRISTVANTQQSVREELVMKIEESRKEAAVAVAAAKSESSSATVQIVKDVNSRWDSAKNIILFVLASIVVGVIAKSTGVQISLPGAP